MTSERAPELPSYRVTLFFGPEPVEGEPGVLACVFNVKKRSWKAGVQVSVEIAHAHLAQLRREIRLTDRIAEALSPLGTEERGAYSARADDLFAQAVTWCKLDLCLAAGLAQENQRIPAADLVPELSQSVAVRAAYVVTYVLTELDLVSDRQSPASF
ncbi:MAG: hypothetical protein HP497_10320 [Nitrospira sp.]|nr:hypothetical protein [Nitrospira sp.]